MEEARRAKKAAREAERLTLAAVEDDSALDVASSSWRVTARTAIHNHYFLTPDQRPTQRRENLRGYTVSS